MQLLYCIQIMHFVHKKWNRLNELILTPAPCLFCSDLLDATVLSQNFGFSMSYASSSGKNCPSRATTPKIMVVEVLIYLAKKLYLFIQASLLTKLHYQKATFLISNPFH
jgi:hypothetical protein